MEYLDFREVRGKNNRIKGYNVYDEEGNVKYYSRRQYDKTFGVLGKRGFSSYEKQKEVIGSRKTKAYKYAKTAHNRYQLDVSGSWEKQIVFLAELNPDIYAYFCIFVFQDIETNELLTYSIPATDNIDDIIAEFKAMRDKYKINEKYILVDVYVEYIEQL